MNEHQDVKPPAQAETIALYDCDGCGIPILADGRATIILCGECNHGEPIVSFVEECWDVYSAR